MDQVVSEQDLLDMAEGLRRLQDCPAFGGQEKFIMRVCAMRIERFFTTRTDDDKRLMECAIDGLGEHLLGIEPDKEVLPVLVGNASRFIH